MNWIEREEQSLEKERRMKLTEDLSLKKLIWILTFAGIILGTQFIQSYETIECPCCQFQIELENPKAREVVGAGWYCNNCGMFQCHGKKCAYCGCSR